MRDTFFRNWNAGIPIDIQWADIDYMERNLDFTIGLDNFTTLPDFANELKNLGVKYTVMVDPPISKDELPDTYPTYDRLVAANVSIKYENGTKFIGKLWPHKPNNYEWTIPENVEWNERCATYNADVEFPDYGKPETLAWFQNELKVFYPCVSHMFRHTVGGVYMAT